MGEHGEMPQFRCLKSEVNHLGQRFPVFVTFASAQTLVDVAEAPAFTPTTTHQHIATNVLTPPIREWQRPRDRGRVDSIAAVFNAPGRLMPNPVLLAANGALVDPGIAITPEMGAGSVPSGLWLVNVPASGEPKPLWILDGQHRIYGMAGSLQDASDLPVVLLLNDQANGPYTGPFLAEIFAQVTTEAEGLKPLHNEWLTFAFGLGDYDLSRNARAAEHKHAMQAVALLCRDPLKADGTNNMFCSNVQFNDALDAAPSFGGFEYTCQWLKKLLLDGYFSRPGAVLTPKQVADAVARAYEALYAVVPAPQASSVFFSGRADNGRKIMQDAFVLGVLAALRSSSAEPNWRNLLTGLQFNTTDWSMTWATSFGGKDQTVSRKLALEVFDEAFTTGTVPGTNLSDLLKGNGAAVDLTASTVTNNDRPSRRDAMAITIQRGSTQTVQISPRRHLKITAKSLNVGRVIVRDARRPLVEYPRVAGGGLLLDINTHTSPLELVLELWHFGGQRSSGELTIRW